MNADFRFYAALIWRQLPWFLLVFTAFAITGILAAITLPAIYQSRVRLIVESSQIPGQLAQSTVELPKQEQLQIFEARLLTRENLLETAQKVGVFGNQVDMNPDQIVQAMRANTTVESSTGRDEATIMTLTFDSQSPSVAATVLSEYLTFILEEDAEYRAQRAEQTEDFFAEDVTRLNEELEIMSARILDFKHANTGALPESLEYRRDLMFTLTERVARNEDEIKALTDQKDRLIQVYEASGQFADQEKLGNQTPQERRLWQLKSDLADASGVYAADSPRITSLRARIEALEASLLKVGGDDDEDGETTTAKRLLDLQVGEIDGKVALLSEQIVEAEARIVELEDSIARTPEIGVRLDALERDYANLQNQYVQAVDRLAKAATGERIETLSRGQRVTVIEQPSEPTEPSRPNRKLIAVTGIGAGVLMGGALIALIELLSSTPKRSKDLVNAIGLTPIATIPYMRNQRERNFRRLKFAALSFSVGMAIPTLVWLVHTYYLPIDFVIRKVIEKTGMMM